VFIGPSRAGYFRTVVNVKALASEERVWVRTVIKTNFKVFVFLHALRTICRNLSNYFHNSISIFLSALVSWWLNPRLAPTAPRLFNCS